jgi:Raf kinase inhibitor-like YbhB/YbcL family protein
MKMAGVALSAAVALAACDKSNQPSAEPTASQPAPAFAMQMTSTAFSAGNTLPEEYTCDGAGRSPPLAWSGAPANAQSFALIVEDPDAPNGTFRHWGVYGIPAGTHELAEGAAQKGGLKQARNDFGKSGYGPPCPPKGDSPHHYHFRLLALDVTQLSGSPGNVKDLLDATDGHVVGNGELLALYGRR